MPKNHHLRYNLAYRYSKFRARFDLLPVVDKIKFLLFLFILALTLVASAIVIVKRF